MLIFIFRATKPGTEAATEVAAPAEADKEEVLDMRYRYSDWMKPENNFWVVETLEKEIDKHDREGFEKWCKGLGFVKTPIEKIWTLEKYKDRLSHSSEYIESRIGEFPIADFNDEVHHRILLEFVDYHQNHLQIHHLENHFLQLVEKQKILEIVPNFIRSSHFFNPIRSAQHVCGATGPKRLIFCIGGAPKGGVALPSKGGLKGAQLRCI